MYMNQRLVEDGDSTHVFLSCPFHSGCSYGQVVDFGKATFKVRNEIEMKQDCGSLSDFWIDEGKPMEI